MYLCIRFPAKDLTRCHFQTYCGKDVSLTTTKMAPVTPATTPDDSTTAPYQVAQCE